MLGVAYKKDVDDLRESPSLKIIELLTARGAKVDYNDPYFPEIHKLRHYNFEGMKSVPIDAKIAGQLTTACSSPPITPATITR